MVYFSLKEGWIYEPFLVESSSKLISFNTFIIGESAFPTLYRSISVFQLIESLKLNEGYIFANDMASFIFLLFSHYGILI